MLIKTQPVNCQRLAMYVVIAVHCKYKIILYNYGKKEYWNNLLYTVWGVRISGLLIKGPCTYLILILATFGLEVKVCQFVYVFCQLK